MNSRETKLPKSKGEQNASTAEERESRLTVRRYIQEHWDKSVRRPGSAQPGILDLPYAYVSPTVGEAFPFLCYWDTYFASMGLWADGRDALARSSAECLCWLIEQYGHVPCYLLDWDLTRSQIPVASLFFRQVYERAPDAAWLHRVRRAMEREHAFWTVQRATSSGLCRGWYHGSPDAVETFSKVIGERLGPVPEEPAARLHFLGQAMAEAETWDFTPRYGGEASAYNPVDLNAMVFALEQNLAWACAEEGDEAAAEAWRGAAQQRREMLDRLCWDEERGAYFDYNYRTGARSDVLSAANTFVLWAGVPDASRAQRVMKAMRQLEEAHGLPACEPGKNERSVPCQWDFPNAWPPLQMAALLGYRKYGYEEDARRVARKYLDNVARNFAATGQLWEKYNACTGGIDVADEYPMPPMMGWTAGVFSTMHAWLDGGEDTEDGSREVAATVPAAESGTLNAVWSANGDTRADTHLALRACFDLPEPATLTLRTLGATSYDVYLDGELLYEGPSRFHQQHAEYDAHPLKLDSGSHVLAVHAHHEGETARIMDAQEPFFWSQLLRSDGSELPLEWKSLVLPGYKRAERRISPLLGWIDWCDTRENPEGWQQLGFDDGDWPAAGGVSRRFLSLDPPTLKPWRPLTLPMTEAASGELVCARGFTSNDPSYIFFLRELEQLTAPAQGVWKRFDLGKIRLGRPRLTLDLPAGAVVEISLSEALEHGRVAPFINCAAGHSCNYDRYIARGGRQVFLPKTPKGGRFLEVHIIAPPEAVRWIGMEFVERSYFGAGEPGAFSCGDPVLEQIWQVGWETFRSCCEDVIIDNPTRERGQWIGDALSVGMEINAVGSGDLSLVKRSLKFAPWSADSLGRIPGLFPGIREFLPTYGSEWTGANLRYVELSGDRSLLEPLFPAAVRNLEAYLPHLKANGLPSIPGTWTFVDWGYLTETNPFAEGEQRDYHAPVDAGLSLFYYEALEAIARWAVMIGSEAEIPKLLAARDRLRETLPTHFAGCDLADPGAEGHPGYHACVLGLRVGVLPEAQKAAAIAGIKAHLLRCFPNDPTAPRLADTSVMSERLITPSFCHFTLPLLIEAGEMDFVLGQYRTCWGWMLETGLTTWPEVFDLRWSHCHQWAGCPTWQLSRYGLGLHPRFDLGERCFVFNLHPGSLSQAAGTVPIDCVGGTARVAWKREGGAIVWSVSADTPITLIESGSHATLVAATKQYSLSLPQSLR